MFKRKLIALDHPDAATFETGDDQKYRELVVWMEDQKIRHYKIDDRQKLRQFDAPDWMDAFGKYLKDIHCPYQPNYNKDVLMDWLLGYAIRMEYGDNVAQLKDKTAAMLIGEISAKRQRLSENPLDSLDFNDPIFKAGVEELAKLLNLPRHPDHLVTLEAACKFIQERLSQATVKEASQAPSVVEKTTQMPLEKYDLGFNTGDKVLDNAGRILRLLHIRELRDLQTKINEIIVAVQNVTADPKVDDRLGEIGV